MKKIFLIASMILGILLITSFAAAAFWSNWGKGVTGNTVATGSAAVAATANGNAVNITIAGKCISDTDGGKKKNVYGGTTYRISRNSVRTLWDNCTGSSVIERWCDANNRTMEQIISCENGCTGGKCTTTPDPDTVYNCTDSDGGINPGKRGYVTETCEECENKAESETFTADTCFRLAADNKTALRERSCLNGSLETTIVRCVGTCVEVTMNVSGTSIAAGRCRPMTTGCRDTDGGINYSVRGVITGLDEGNSPVAVMQDNNKLAINNYSLTEYYCNGTEVENITLNCKDETGDPSSISINGICTSSTALCTDSDYGAQALRTKGTVTSITGETASDYCATPFILAEMSCRDLSESHADVKVSYKNQAIYREMRYCYRGCMNGACIDGIGFTVKSGGHLDHLNEDRYI